MSESIVHLEDGVPIDPSGTLRGAWREIGVRRVEPGRTERLVADGCEHAVFVWSGSGTANVGAEPAAAVGQPVGAGHAFTIVRGDTVAFEAGPDGLRLFVVTLDA